MGRIFQMKSVNYFQLCFIVFILVATAVYADKTAKTYTSDFSGETQKEKAFLKKLRQDETKIDLAIRNTKALIDKSRNKSYLPELYLRLADLYVEKSRVTYFIRKSLKKTPLSKLEALPANALKNQAIEIYQRILDHFPSFDQADKVHFFMAHEFREMGKIKEMVRHYRQIIQTYPESSYVPETYLLLGDHYFKSQNLDMAQTHYTKIIEYPHSPAYAISQYKLGWCYINRADFSSAIKRFETALRSSKNKQSTDIDTYRHVDIRLESLVDMAYCYVDCYKEHSPQTAIAYFQSYAWSLTSYMASLEKLAKRYFIKKKWAHSAAIYRKLSDLCDDSDKLLRYAQKIFECVRATHIYDQIAFDVQMIVKALEKQRYATHMTSDDKLEKEKEYEVFAREMITLQHETARKNKNLAALKKASEAYIAYLNFFYLSPVFWDMKNNCAEALFASKQYMQAGKYYETLYHDSPGEKTTKKDILFSAITSYYHALKNKDHLNAYEKNYCRQGLLATGKLYVTQYPDTEHVEDVRFNMAWITFDEGHYDSAINKFKTFISEYPNGRASRAAVHLILDAYYMKEDFKALVNFGNDIISNPEITNTKLKEEVSGIVASAEQKIVSSLSLSAIDDWEKGRAQMFNMAQKHSRTALGEKALIALLGTALEKNDLKTFFSAGKTLIQKYPQSRQHENHLNLFIQTSMTIGAYQLLVQYLEIFCKTFPDHSDTIMFMEQAAAIYQVLGNHNKANRLYQQLLSDRKQKANIKDILFQWVKNLIENHQLSDALKVLENSELLQSKKDKIVARAKIACLNYQLNQKDRAQKIYQQLSPLLSTQNDSDIQDALLEMIFYHTMKAYSAYLSNQMSDKLDPELFKQKQAQLVQLQKVYTQFLKYPSPRWVLAGCAHLYSIYTDFANFLRHSPAPDLNDSERKQYQALIDKKAKAYEQNAAQFKQTFHERSQKWSMCDPKLIAWMKIIDPKKTPQGPFYKKTQQVDDIITLMPPNELYNLYEKRAASPKGLTPLMSLAGAYMERKEWGQAFLLCADGLRIDQISDFHKSALLTIQGKACLFQQKDRMAQSLFKKALDARPENKNARSAHEALLTHYGYQVTSP